MTATVVGERLQRTWEDAPGLLGFLSTVDHKRIGRRYLVTAFVFLVLGGIQALVMRLQLTQGGAEVLSPETYNALMTMHGTTMIFLFNTPVFAGFGNYFVPLQVGTRDMAFPRLNALSYWVFLFSGAFLYFSFFVGQIPDGGWFAYTPLTTEFSPGAGLDFWAIGVVFLGVSTTVGAVNFLVTIFKLRAPGMSLSRMPLFVWSMIGMSAMILLALPAITLGPLMLEFDRALGTQFFTAAAGGDPVLYQHLFWFWGHPEVYILLLPAAGMVSMIIPTFARRPVVGYTWIAAAFIAIAFISFGVWVHHMFVVGLSRLATSFFSAASMVITVPSGVQIFAWTATIWRGDVRWRTPMLYSVGFLFIFMLGGFTGVMVGVLPFDQQVHDSYFIVAHFHYVLNGAVVFPIFAGLYYWLPKITGRLLSDRVGTWSFWMMFVGFNVGFFPMHILGLLGMPRRVYTYEAGLGWGDYNLVSTLGAYLFAAGVALTLANLAWSLWRGRPAGPNPWDGDSLEWATTSPPPTYNFRELPAVSSRHPLWTSSDPDTARDLSSSRETLAPRELHHETFGTAGMEAGLEDVLVMPPPSIWPLALTIGMTAVAVGGLVRSVLVTVAGAVACGVALVAWHWPGAEVAP